MSPPRSECSYAWPSRPPVFGTGDQFAAVPDQIVAEADTVADGKPATFQQHVDTVRVRELS
jgi:hypothetical protein|tara:strand:- start:3346 stop:3528 length:183 start_codon:yes stop_codon:yes gene_type:complete